MLGPANNDFVSHTYHSERMMHHDAEVACSTMLDHLREFKHDNTMHRDADA
jgi:hypothetical protein